MKFSNFLFPESKTPDGDYDVIEESLREAEFSEELGYDVIWLAEHHFDGGCAYVDPTTFAAAVAAGNPVIAKANSSHPGTTRLFAEQAQLAAEQTGMPPGTVQLIYRTSHADGERLVADPRNGATAYTGSRSAGLTLKAAADAAGKPIYLELSSVNPMILLPGALEERSQDIAEELAGSCLMGTGQFCTNPGLVVTVAGDKTSQFIDDLVTRFSQAPVGTLLSAGVQKSLGQRRPCSRQADNSWWATAREGVTATLLQIHWCRSPPTSSLPPRRRCRQRPLAMPRYWLSPTMWTRSASSSSNWKET